MLPAALTIAFVVVRHLVLTEPFQEGGVAEGAPGFVELGAMLAHQVWFTLIPVGALFDWQMPEAPAGVGVLALAPLAVVAYALPPAVRYTDHGIRRVPPELIEAAKVSGCTPWQMRTKAVSFSRSVRPGRSDQVMRSSPRASSIAK